MATDNCNSRSVTLAPEQKSRHVAEDVAETRAHEYRALCITVPRQPKRGKKKKEKSSGCDGHTMNSNRSLLHQLRRCTRVRICYTYRVVDTHDTIWACDDREIGRSMITDGGERRTEVI